jgi:hypothetical protein
MTLTIALMLTGLLAMGCSNITEPAYGAVGDVLKWAGFYGKEYLEATDSGYFVAQDAVTKLFHNRLIATDLLKGQMLPQRDSNGYDADGKYNVTYADVDNDLNIYESPDTGWHDDAGAWALTDDDTTDTWVAVDVESRQGFIWAAVLKIDIMFNDILTPFYLDLTNVAPAWTVWNTNIACDNAHYSIVLDDNLVGINHWVFMLSNIYYVNANPNITVTGGVEITTLGDYPKIIVDGEERFWVFHTDISNLICKTSFDDPNDPVFNPVDLIYTGTSLTDYYDAVWLATDDTIHVVLVDFNIAGDTYLIYLRRTPNGWSDPVILRTVDSTLTDKDSMVWPNISVDPMRGIFIYYIFIDDYTTTIPHAADPGGDLCGLELLPEDYHDDYDDPGNWIPYNDIDNSEDQITWVLAIDDSPV